MKRLILTTLVALAAPAGAGTASAVPILRSECPAAPDGARLVDTVKGNVGGETGEAAACGIAWTTPTGSGSRLCAMIVTNDVDALGEPVQRVTSGCADSATVEVDPQLSSGHVAGTIPAADGPIAVDLTVTPGSPSPSLGMAGGLSASLWGGGASGGSISAPTFGTDAAPGDGTVDRSATVPASASGLVVAAPVGNQTGFATRAMVVAQGGGLQFLNADPTQTHNVYSNDRGADGAPLFKSATVPSGAPVPVVGVDALPAGDYDFFCTVHSTMKGTLTVVAAPTGRHHAR